MRLATHTEQMATLVTVRMMCHEDPSRFPWQCATDRMERMHCRFLAVNMTGPWWADVGSEAVGRGVPEMTNKEMDYKYRGFESLPETDSPHVENNDLILSSMCIDLQKTCPSKML
jgi:hypothetical protein